MNNATYQERDNAKNTSSTLNASLYNEAESALLNDVIRAMEIASEKGITDHQMSLIISQAANAVGFNILFPDSIQDSHLSNQEIVNYMEKLVEYIHDADK